MDPDSEFLLNYGSQNTFFIKFFYTVVASLTILIGAFDKMDRDRDVFQDRHRDMRGDKFDFIIVGGGSSGAVLANRLSDDYTVLLLERGGDPYPWQAIPSFTQYMLNQKHLDWTHKTVRQEKACLSLQNQQAGICQGNGLGGSSSLSYMNYLRGSPFDYNNWANISGDKGWDFENLLPYFKRHEDYQGPWADTETHGSDGDIRIEIPGYTGMANSFIAAGQQLGYKQVDLNGWFSEGFDFVVSPIRRGYRQATFPAFIQKIRPRGKLIIRKFANVTKVLISNNDTTAFGVEYDRHGRLRQAYATREVIISAGALQTPKLLMLSGIGPKSHLESLDIPVLVDLPVGQNLQDHLITFLGPFVTKVNTTFLLERDLTGPSVAEFGISSGHGPLTSTGVQANALIVSASTKSSAQSLWPNLQLTLFGLAIHNNFDKDFTNIFHMDSNASTEYFEPSKGKDSFFIIVSLGRPLSKGTVLLKDKDPNSELLIDPNYLDDKNDMQVMIDGVHKALDLVERSESFKSMNTSFTTKVFPGCEKYEFRSKAYWRCYIRHFTVSSSNVAGSCAMGQKNESSAVVDSELRVNGVKRLRVMDASIMPSIVVSGTEAASIMIGEKGADLLKTYWQSRSY